MLQEAVTDDRLTGREFEQILAARHAEYEKAGMASVGKYGVQMSVQDGEKIAIQSLPDFEGVRNGGEQVIFDAKVCSQASFALAKYRGEPRRGARYRQLKHMRTRARFGSTCFFLVHWNARVLKTRSEAAETYAFWVEDNWFWEAFDRREINSITREHCRDIGELVPWDKMGRARTLRPNWLKVLK